MTDYIHGSARIKIDGDNQIVDVDAKLKIGGRVNSVKTVGEKTFRSKKYTKSELEMKIPHTGDVDLIEEQIRAGVEIQFQSDNGATYVVPITSQVGELGTGEEGLITLTYEGDAAVKS